MKSRLITKYYELRQQRQCAAIMERNWEALVMSQFRVCSFSTCCVKTLQKAPKVGTARPLMLERISNGSNTYSTLLLSKCSFRSAIGINIHDRKRSDINHLKQ